jgi:hypothetical protein
MISPNVSIDNDYIDSKYRAKGLLHQPLRLDYKQGVVIGDFHCWYYVTRPACVFETAVSCLAPFIDVRRIT